MADELRFRRLDGWNFVIESKRVVKDPESPNFGKEQWDSERFFSNPRMMLKEAIAMGIEGTGAKSLLQALQASESRILKALDDAIKTGALRAHDLVPDEVTAARKKMKEVSK